MSDKIALIGFGEAASAFACEAGWSNHACAFDTNPVRRDAMAQASVNSSNSAQEVLQSANTVLSLVTADQALKAAQTYATLVEKGALWIDMNSISPATKREAAMVIEKHGARYVDAAILAPVHPAKREVPILLAGAAAEEAKAELEMLGFSNTRIVGNDIGRASAIKMIRSVMVKGLEALTDEMMAAADAAGVVDEVLASLDVSDKSENWRVKAAYNLERMTTHGERRAAEMEEVAKTLRVLGVEPVMTEGTVKRQRDAAVRPGEKRNAA
ncbi:MAG: DUF1932 domain-containing protein [Erythrobacter sp.]